ncbi:MAG: hypothetical protein F6J96_18315 [Symploca sp. SIO1C2]|nr:hypothetical protein [Symploca sp. SIO1C2]
MPNPKPKQTKEFKKYQYKLIGEELPPGEKLSKTPVCVKLPESVTLWLKALPVEERGKWLRGVIWEAAQKEESFKSNLSR